MVREATSALGSFEAAIRWLRAPNPSLNGRKPIDMMTSTPGAAAVSYLLAQSDSTGYSNTPDAEPRYKLANLVKRMTPENTLAEIEWRDAGRP